MCFRQFGLCGRAIGFPGQLHLETSGAVRKVSLPGRSRASGSGEPQP
jgi:hypothetical protein